MPRVLSFWGLFVALLAFANPAAQASVIASQTAGFSGSAVGPGRRYARASHGPPTGARTARPVAQPPRSLTRLVRGWGESKTPGQPVRIAFDNLDVIGSLRVEDFITAQRADWR